MHPMIRSIDKSKKRGLGPLGGEDTDAKMVRPRFSKSSSFDSTSTDMQGESSPWKSLPSDILERAFAMLPLSDIFRLRGVCKRWNALIHCAQFQEWSMRCPLPWGPFYLPWVRWKETMSRSVPWSSYNLGERKWISMPPFEFPLLNGYSEWHIMTTNRGLICFRSWDGRGILVCNPMTNKWKELPSSRRLDSRFTTISDLIVDEQRNSYKILFAGNSAYNWNNPRYGMVDLYDSMMNTWSIGQSMSVGNVMKDGAYCSGEFYILTQRSRKSPYAVEILDLTTLRWREETIPVPNGFRPHPRIVACLDRIYLVVGRNNTGNYNIANVFIYQLDRSNRWTKISEYPDEHLLGDSGGIHGCWSNRSKIYVGLYSSDVWVAVYDLATSCWEEPIYNVDVLNLQDIFPRTKFTFQPNIRVCLEEHLQKPTGSS